MPCSLKLPRISRRTWVTLGVAAMIAAVVYPPWKYDLGAPVSRDVVRCEAHESHAPLWSPPGVPREMTQTLMCGTPRVDAVVLGLRLAGIAAVTGLFATFLAERRAPR
jgi:hypothetical protein